MVLAAVGIHGLLAYRVRQQEREIGIRMALGANPRDVVWSVLRQAIFLMLAGAVGGLVGALALSQVIRSNLYGVAPTDPLVFMLSAGVMVILAALATWLPARRATRVNPVEALRAE
jgi:ABC-type antimicrobial peptide transport system permease subunit